MYYIKLYVKVYVITYKLYHLQTNKMISYSKIFRLNN